MAEQIEPTNVLIANERLDQVDFHSWVGVISSGRNFGPPRVTTAAFKGAANAAPRSSHFSRWSDEREAKIHSSQVSMARCVKMSLYCCGMNPRVKYTCRGLSLSTVPENGNALSEAVGFLGHRAAWSRTWITFRWQYVMRSVSRHHGMRTASVSGRARTVALVGFNITVGLCFATHPTSHSRIEH